MGGSDCGETRWRFPWPSSGRNPHTRFWNYKLAATLGRCIRRHQDTMKEFLCMANESLRDLTCNPANNSPTPIAMRWRKFGVGSNDAQHTACTQQLLTAVATFYTCPPNSWEQDTPCVVSVCTLGTKVFDSKPNSRFTTRCKQPVWEQHKEAKSINRYPFERIHLTNLTRSHAKSCPPKPRISQSFFYNCFPNLQSPPSIFRSLLLRESPPQSRSTAATSHHIARFAIAL